MSLKEVGSLIKYTPFSFSPLPLALSLFLSFFLSLYFISPLFMHPCIYFLTFIVTLPNSIAILCYTLQPFLSYRQSESLCMTVMQSDAAVEHRQAEAPSAKLTSPEPLRSVITEPVSFATRVLLEDTHYKTLLCDQRTTVRVCTDAPCVAPRTISCK